MNLVVSGLTMIFIGKYAFLWFFFFTLVLDITFKIGESSFFILFKVTLDMDIAMEVTVTAKETDMDIVIVMRIRIVRRARTKKVKFVP